MPAILPLHGEVLDDIRPAVVLKSQGIVAGAARQRAMASAAVVAIFAKGMIIPVTAQTCIIAGQMQYREHEGTALLGFRPITRLSSSGAGATRQFSRDQARSAAGAGQNHSASAASRIESDSHRLQAFRHASG